MGTPSMCIAWENILAKPLADLAEALDLEPQPIWSQVLVQGISEDTRCLACGDLFVAIPGQDQDGICFVDQAIKKGAVAVVCERPIDLAVPVLVVPSARKALAQLSASYYGHPTRELFAVGVTGTNGKTTVCHWTADLLGRKETKLLSTVENEGIDGVGNTTPSSSTIQRLARAALDEGLRHLIIEASSAGIEQDRVHAVDFDVCVFTNLSLEHTHHHAGLEAYKRAKLKLFEGLRPTACAVVNRDDPMYAAIAAATRAQILTYGVHVRSDVRLTDVRQDHRGSWFIVTQANGGQVAMTLPYPGEHNIANALAAISVGIARGLPMQTLAERLACAGPVLGRMEFYRRGDGLVAVVDFAHNASSLETILRFLHGSTARVIAVFGCPGDGEHEKRVGMGKVAGQWAKVVVLTSDNPKTEDPRAIASEICEGMVDADVSVMIELDRRRAIHVALSQAGGGDVVLLAGKGHETVQLIGKDRIPYSDADVLRKLGFDRVPYVS